ncbi:MAG: 2-succinyl-6-hydroxy-2,4-cyclohexadiene-1-carboxylate synthase [candidate division Zixibacteria bacterium]|nr:2-succinyl-6-hydroxy-2,4-cyclohexadiene-1-carboxylate synthase [candidate division Zixibacteria bacterium]MDH3937318.1 2-succinyl-6-hydroxy-2,4-cyclohexadiene-1-carboxylate synthase [candidate division Zixibacteria bacterium]MDH4034728.1 2-succinyl-6-hydroxy-2,4-cyclohexadiene-1-carboxylate synthase [candidate division Zixibacteria bacterium]
MTEPNIIRLHYQRRGDPRHQAVLLLHGFMGSADDWDEEITDPLVESGLQVLAVDLPGHGRTVVQGDKENYRMECVATAIVNLLQELGIESPHLLGYSMGGRLALYMAVRHSQHFRRIVLESASPGLEAKTVWYARVLADAELARRMHTQPMEPFLREWYAQPLFASMATRPERLERLIARRMENDLQGLQMSLQGMGTGAQVSLWSELPSVNLPILLIAGGNDSKFCVIGRQIETRCPFSSLEIVPGCGHNVHFERPREYAKLVREFLHD